MSLLSPTRCPRLTFVLCTSAILCTPVGAVRAQSAKPFEAFSNSAETLSNSARTVRDSVVAMARAQIGRRYRTGGVSPEKGFDCSGLVQYVLAGLNLQVPRTARQQAAVGLPLTRDTSRLLPGDLLTFSKGKKGRVSLVCIYVGEGRYVHASSVAGKVIESSIDRPFSPLIKAWHGARRILSLDDSLPTLAVAAPKNER
jgi:cell wall-associated NlpC family hydrolase